MRLEQATQQMQLRKVSKNDCGCGDIRVAKAVARKVFELSAAFGEPYQGRPEDWAKKWLASKRFTLIAVAPYQVAVPYANRIDRNKVISTINASVDGTVEPIVVDINKNGIGKTQRGYVPNVIVVDGKHRHKAQLQMGKDRILAWVGELALEALQERQKSQKKFVLEASTNQKFAEPRTLSALESTAILYAGISMPVVRQDSGDGGSRPTGGTQVKAGKHPEGCDCQACKDKMEAVGAGGMGGPGASLGSGSGPTPPMKGLNATYKNARSSGSLEEPDPSDTKVPPDPSDKGPFTDPSDRRQWQPDKPQMYPPDRAGGYGSPDKESPGSGVGPRLRDTQYGAKNSELSRGKVDVKSKGMDAGPVKVKKIWTRDKKRMEAVAPPGREKQVLKLKQKFGKNSAIPFKIAWSQENK